MNGQNLINRMQYIEVTIGVLLRDEERKREDTKVSNALVRRAMK